MPSATTVKQMRSFIEAYKALGKCIPHYSDCLSPLEDSVAGKNSKDHVVWNDDIQKAFKDSQQLSILDKYFKSYGNINAI